ncbi:MAG: response regulator [Desulfobulbaceae bacterium]|nr:response regulator [Desulfobulbaceae bacterium]
MEQERRKILIAEDSKFFGVLLQKRLGREPGFEVVWAKGLAEARVALEGQEGFFAAILDFNLPDAPYGEVIDEVVARNIPAIVFTGSISDEVRDIVWSKDVVDYVLKNDRNSPDYIVALLYRLERNSKIKVLVVDDSSFFRKVIGDLLKIHRYQVLTAGDGREALTVLAQHPEIRLVLTDFNMPHLDGFQLIEEIRKTYTRDDLGIIGISSADNHVMAAQFIKNGANDFIIKQAFLSEEFYSRVTHCIENIENIQEIREISELKNKFLGMAAHDLRNPLSSIRGFSELMLEGGLDDDSIQEFTSLIHSASEEMLVLLNDLLDISHIESGKFILNLEEGDLAAVVARRVKLISNNAAKKQMELETQLEAVPVFSFDPGKISQAIDNLISNAIKYAPHGTTVFIALKALPGQVRFSVRDQGPGISSEEGHKLFAEFSKLSSQATGGEKSTGLGLAITKKIIKEHGGEIGVESEPGQGATFYFTIPY